MAFQACHLRPVNFDCVEYVGRTYEEDSLGKSFNFTGDAVAIFHHNYVRRFSCEEECSEKKHGENDQNACFH
jgi:hypothetical protein